jgi:hypothetical protein
MEAGWFDSLSKGVEVAAQIGIPLLTGRGVSTAASKRAMRQAIDLKIGNGWFDSLLKGIEVAAKIAVPLVTGRGATGLGGLIIFSKRPSSVLKLLSH